MARETFDEPRFPCPGWLPGCGCLYEGDSWEEGDICPDCAANQHNFEKE